MEKLGTKPFHNKSRLFVPTKKHNREPVKPLSIVKIVNKLFHASFSITGLSSPAFVDFKVSFVLERHLFYYSKLKFLCMENLQSELKALLRYFFVSFTMKFQNDLVKMTDIFENLNQDNQDKLCLTLAITVNLSSIVAIVSFY